MKRIILWLMVAGTFVSTVSAGQPTFGLNRVEALQGEAGGYPLWQYAATLLWVALAFLVAPVLDFIGTRILKRLTARTKTNLDDKLLEILNKPIKVIVVLVALTIGIGAYEWPAWVEHVLTIVFVLAVAITVTYVAGRMVDLLVEYFEQKFFASDTQLAQLMLPVLGTTFKVFVIILGVLTTAQHLGMPVASVLTGLGVGGVAVALAAQSSLANIFGSIVILTDRPFRVGDRVQIGDVDGSVETIGLRSTRIRTLEGHLVTMPNKTVADSNIINVSLRPNIRQLFTINLTYNTSPERMREALGILREIIQKHPLTHDCIVNWKDYGPHSLDIFVAYWCKSTDFKQFLVALEDINLEIKRRFDGAGLDFAFPTQTIQLQQPVSKA